MSRLATFAFVCFVAPLAIAQSSHSASSNQDAGALDLMAILGNKLARAASAVDGFSHSSFSTGASFITLPAHVTDQLMAMAPPGLKHGIASVLTTPQEHWEKTLVIAREFVQTHPELVSSVMNCVVDNVTSSANVSCDLEGTMWHAWQEFEVETGLTHSLNVGGGTRPVATGYARPSSFLKFMFWFAMAWFHLSNPVIQVPSYIQSAIEVVETAIQGASNKFASSQYASSTNAAHEHHQLARWQTIMAVFPSFEQFKRAYHHNSEYQNMLVRLCSTAEDGSQAASATTEGSTMESCWAHKQLQLARSGRFLKHTPRILGVPVSPDYLVAVFAMCSMFAQYQIRNFAGCNVDALGTGWQCSNGGADGSACILTCKNSGSTISKIDAKKSNLAVCSSGDWRPDATFRATCIEKPLATYDYGANRHGNRK